MRGTAASSARFVVIAQMALAPVARAADTQNEAPPQAEAQAPRRQASVSISSNLGVKTEGFGAAAVADLFSAHFDGSVGAFTAGFGFGASYKWEGKGKRYPFELGLFVAPQFTLPKEGPGQGTVAALLHFNAFGGFGVGLGYDFFKSGTGFVAANNGTLFFTLGYGVTNARDTAEQ